MDKSKIDPTALPDVYKRIYDLLGEEALLTLWESFRGEQLNFPVHLMDRTKVRKKIVEDYNGVNADALADRYGFTKRWVKQVVSEAARNSKNSSGGNHGKHEVL